MSLVKKNSSKAKSSKAQSTRNRNKSLEEKSSDFSDVEETKSSVLRDAKKNTINKYFDGFSSTNTIRQTKKFKNNGSENTPSFDNDDSVVEFEFNLSDDGEYNDKEISNEEDSELDEEEEDEEKNNPKNGCKSNAQRSKLKSELNKQKRIQAHHNYFRYNSFHMMSQSKTIYFNTLYYSNDCLTRLINFEKFPANVHNNFFSLKKPAQRQLKFINYGSPHVNDKYILKENVQTKPSVYKNSNLEDVFQKWKDVSGFKSDEELDFINEISLKNLNENVSFDKTISLSQDDNVYKFFDSSVSRFPNNNLKEGVNAYWNGLKILQDLGPAIKPWDMKEQKITGSVKFVYNTSLFPNQSLFSVNNQKIAELYLTLVTFMLNNNIKSSVKNLCVSSRRTTKFSTQSYQIHNKKIGVTNLQKKKPSAVVSNKRIYESSKLNENHEEEFDDSKQKNKMTKEDVDSLLTADEVNFKDDEEIVSSTSQENYWSNLNHKNNQTDLQKNDDEVTIDRDEHGNVILPAFIGTVCLMNLGEIIHDNEKYHTKRYIFPIGFKSKRLYFSLVDPSRRCWYTQEILNNENNNEPIFRLTCDDFDLSPVEGPTASGVWSEVLEKVGPERQKLAGRKIHSTVSGPEQFGLSHPIIHKLIEELPGADKCVNYNPSLPLKNQNTSKKAK